MLPFIRAVSRNRRTSMNAIIVGGMLVASLLGGGAATAQQAHSRQAAQTRASARTSTSSTILGALGIPVPGTQTYPRTRVNRHAQGNGSARPTWYTDAQGC